MLQATLERRLTVEARAIEIDAQADSAHDQTIAHQQHLLAGGDPELQVVLLAKLRQHTFADVRGDLDLRIGHGLHLRCSHLQRLDAQCGGFKGIQGRLHQRIAATQQ
ncbi:hypothetical protein D3C81_1703590 [compost metagenome]